MVSWGGSVVTVAVRGPRGQGFDACSCSTPVAQ